MYATKKQLLRLLDILDSSCTKDNESNAADHRHDLFDSIDRNCMNELQTELESEMEEEILTFIDDTSPANLETK
jgi:hypothetical protein